MGYKATDIEFEKWIMWREIERMEGSCMEKVEMLFQKRKWECVYLAIGE
jgi:hypothetical protein